MSVQQTIDHDPRQRTDIRVRDGHFSAAEVYHELHATEGMAHD